jgi:hypothetical protein
VHPRFKSTAKAIGLAIVICLILVAPFFAVPLFAIAVKVTSSIIHLNTSSDVPGGDAAREMIARVTSDPIWRDMYPESAGKLQIQLTQSALRGLPRLKDAEIADNVMLEREIVSRLNVVDCAAFGRGTYTSDIFRMAIFLGPKDTVQWFTIQGDAALADGHKLPVAPVDSFGLQGALSELKARSAPDILSRMDALSTHSVEMNDHDACTTIRQFFDGYARLEPEAQAILARGLETH